MQNEKNPEILLCINKDLWFPVKKEFHNIEENKVDTENLTQKEKKEYQEVLCCKCKESKIPLGDIFECNNYDDKGLKCTAVFCSECKELIKSKKEEEKENCPLCHKICDPVKSSRIENKLKDVKIICFYSNHGCKEVIRYPDYINHLSQCPYRIYGIRCHCESSKTTGTIEFIKAHASECPYWRILCPDCKGVCYRSEYENHRNSDNCLKKQIDNLKCENKILECVTNKLKCENENLKSVNKKDQQRIRELEDEVNRLECQNSFYDGFYDCGERNHSSSAL